MDTSEGNFSTPACPVNPSSVLFDWLKERGVDDKTISLLKNEMIDGCSFAMLKEDDLRKIGITKLGPLKWLSRLVFKWRRVYSTLHSDSSSSGSSSDDETPHHRLLRSHRDAEVCERNTKVWKVVISSLYAFLSLGVASYVMVLAHERLPDISKYPPLPDICLDNIPYIPWAFEAAELIGVILNVMLFVILVFHKYRLIIVRRYCSLLGTIFLLRSVTMVITSLSVPGKHLLQECRPFVFHSYRERFSRAVSIWLGMGMTLQGVRTCGDYMFSGHTTVLTITNFFITEYTPSRFALLHTFSWVLNVFGVFFILASHEHYSIDVFIALFITSRLFVYYHWQANNQHLSLRDKHRARIWFPLLSFFECDVRGKVPHEYVNPLKQLLQLWRKYRPRHISRVYGALPLLTSVVGGAEAAVLPMPTQAHLPSTSRKND